ncbi:MAG: ATP-binding cassette domain-containing protein [Atlantibacter hermannii]|uniref:peptidase domain-containing ABC transporter n=1 Tax=Atlantibacter hermannii TaxID=565 RepID=UPI0029052B92|nr:ATP-binding cassette domain-containing protein [Atlantibacter hermannii]MDU1950358.1 ATP-binding cassette domain-containing protein [Atlantibacter hermannii]
MKTIIPEMVYQGETHECGLACIAMLAETQHLNVTLPELRETFPASEHGTSLVTLCSILEALSVPVYPVAFSFDELDALPLPAILHYGASHYVLLAYRRGNYVCVMNPAIGEQILPLAALKSQISGYALVLDNSAPKVLSPKMATPSQRSKRLQSLSLAETARIPGIYGLMLFSLLVSLTLFVMPGMINMAMNQFFSSTSVSSFDWPLFLLIFIGSSALAVVLRIVTERLVKRFVILRSTMGFSHLLDNNLRFFDKRSPGDIFSRFAAWQMGLARKAELDNGLRTDWIIALIALGVMCAISPLLAAISGVGVTLMGAVSVWAIYRDRFYTQQLQTKSAEQNDFILESIQGFSCIKSAGLESQRKKEFARYTWTLFTWIQKQRIYEQYKGAIYQFIGSAEMVLFMALALPLLREGTIGMGAFFAYSFIRQIFTSNVTKIFWSIIQKNQLHIIDTRAQDLFSLDEETPLQPVLDVPSFTHEAIFRHIDFRYDREKVLHQLSFSLKQGRRMAIVGESGAGKTTLLRILVGLMPPSAGEISLDGKTVTSRQLAALAFLQSQEDILFHASVQDNITLFDDRLDEAKHKRIRDALEGLQLDEVVSQLPGGLNALVRESHVALSVGQRQRLLLARAMYSNKPIMVLDEPTASLDSATAFHVMQALTDHCRATGKTLITVTHSEALLPLFDDVWGLKNGTLEPVTDLSAWSDETCANREVGVCN